MEEIISDNKENGEKQKHNCDMYREVPCGNHAVNAVNCKNDEKSHDERQNKCLQVTVSKRRNGRERLLRGTIFGCHKNTIVCENNYKNIAA